MIARKIISASISGSTFAIILGVILPFVETASSITSYLFSVVISIPFYLMYSFPVILIYGVITSIISDKVGEVIASKINMDKLAVFLSGFLHLRFGLILLFISLGASIWFLITDQVLKKHQKRYKWNHAIKSLGIPLAVWLFFMGIVYIEHLLNAS